MNASELLAEFKQHGIEISRAGENVKVTASPGSLTPEQRTLIVENKAAILAYLGGGEKCDPQIVAELPRNAPNIEETAPAIYREYTLPDGEILQLTKEEFDNVVEVFRMLWRQDQRNSRQLKAA